MSDRRHTRRAACRDRIVAAVTAMMIGSTVLVPLPTSASRGEPPAPPITPSLISPRVLDHGVVAETLVRVRGGSVCSGTPIAGTAYVVTAAHCVLDLDGEPGNRTVVRGDEVFDVVGVFVDTAYHDDPSVRLDAAVLVLDAPVPGRGARWGTSPPATGEVTVAGYQPLDTDGTLLRGTSPSDRPSPTGDLGPVRVIESAPSGCTVDVTDLRVTRERIQLPCGLIPGASGGGLFVTTGSSIVLIGIVSTVTSDLTANSVVPITAARTLMKDPNHFHELSVTSFVRTIERF